MSICLTCGQHLPAPVVGVRLQKLLRMFLKRRSPLTQKAYGADLRSLALYCKLTVHKALTRVLSSQRKAERLLHRWLRYSAKSGRSTATQNRRAATLCSFVSFAQAQGAIAWRVKLPKIAIVPVKDARGPSLVDAKRLLAACGNDLSGCRNKAILYLAIVHGLRRSEIGRVSTADLQDTRLLVHSKGGRQHWVKLTRQTRSAIAKWISAWEKSQSCVLRGAIFRSLAPQAWGRPLSGSGVYDLIVAHGSKLGLFVRPTGLRHTAVTNFLDRSGGDMHAAQKFARHSMIKSTAAYSDKRGAVHTVVDSISDEM